MASAAERQDDDDVRVGEPLVDTCGARGLRESRWTASMLIEEQPSVHSTEPTTSCDRNEERAFMPDVPSIAPAIR